MQSISRGEIAVTVLLVLHALLIAWLSSGLPEETGLFRP